MSVQTSTPFITANPTPADPIAADPIAATATPVAGIDPRGPQFVATLTAVTLAVALLASPPVALALAAVQAALFAIGATRGVQSTPGSLLFRTFVRPRLSAPTELEDPAPPRFAQAVGLVFASVAVLGFLAGATILAQIALGFALVAAVLNAAFRFCLGCEMYLLIKRVSA